MDDLPGQWVDIGDGKVAKLCLSCNEVFDVRCLNTDYCPKHDVEWQKIQANYERLENEAGKNN